MPSADAATVTTVYTDGACSGNPGPGGWAWAVPGGPYRSGAAARTTNQRMEITAVLEAVTTLPGPLEVRSDSSYVVNCFRDRWWEGWLARGWLNASKKPVANRDLWEPLIAAYRDDPRRLRFQWVKGHGADPMNDYVDRLAVAAAANQRGQEGTTAPVGGDGNPPAGFRRNPTAGGSVGTSGASAAGFAAGSPGKPAGFAAGSPGKPAGFAAGSPGKPAGFAAGSAAAGSAPPAPPGHLLAVAGLRPPALGGYDENPVAAGTRSRLSEILGAKAGITDDLVVLSGLGLGAEQLGAEAAAAAGVPYTAVLAFPGQHELWPPASRARFDALLGGAKDTVVLQSRRPASRQAAGAALARRDAWIARHAAEAVVVWDGKDPLVGRAVRSLQDRLGEEQVWVLEPVR